MMRCRRTRVCVLPSLTLLLAVGTACGGDDLGPLADIPVVIQDAASDWVDSAPFVLEAIVTKAGSGDAVEDGVSVSVELRQVGPLGSGQSFDVPASRSPADPTRFKADAGAVTDLLPNQVVRYRWKATAPIGGETTELGATDIVEAQVGAESCDEDPETWLRDMHAAVFDRFGGLTTVAQIQAEGYALNNHGWPSIDGMGVGFVHANPNLAVDTPQLLLFTPAAGADLVDNYDCTAGCAGGGVVPCTCSPCACSPCDACADEPYVFAGWAYGSFSFDPVGPRPVFGCVPHHYWFVHEAGWHTAAGGMLLDPTPGNAFDLPSLTCPDTAAQCATPDRYHPRIWDLHFWVDGPAMAAEGTAAVLPRASIFNTDSEGQLFPTGGLPAPTTPPDDTYPEGQCMFFYPELGCDGEPG